MRYFDRIAVLVALGLFGSFAFAQATVAGATPASFRVTETGAAEHRIPIRVPPGIAGMEPKLALTYNSHAGNGLLGMGWGLEGLSAIARCPRTVPQDGVSGGINYDWNDRYCMDGQRLVAISGSYGADGTEYRTERESFAKVVSYGTAGNGPAWFKVWTKSGQILEYGNTADSRVEAQGKSTARLWALNKVSDSKGNTILFNYFENTGISEVLPASIVYAANQVTFGYVGRPDATPLYEAGSKTVLGHVLTQIGTAAYGQAVTSYQLTYDQSTATLRSRLTSIKECEGSGAACQSPLSVTYTNADNGFDSVAWVLTGHPLQSGDGATATYIADFNGDGRLDVLRGYADPSSNAIWYGTATGFDGPYLVLTGHPLQSADGNTRSYVADFNGDGKADVLRGYADPNSNAIWYSTGSGFTDTQLALTGHPLQGSGGATATYIGDFNGDGKADVLRGYADPNSNAIWYSTGSGFTDTQLALTGHPLQSSDGNTRTYVADFNGDGKADVLRGYVDPNSNAIWYSTGSGFTDYQLVLTGHPLHHPTGVTATYIGDFNGDGKADVLRGYSDPNYNYIWYSTATGFTDTQPALTGHPLQGPDGGTRSYIGDFNGDGKADLLRGYADPASNAIWYSTGVGFTDYQLVLTGAQLNGSTTRSYVGDFNGDGKADFLRGYGDPAANSVWYSHQPFPDLIITLSNGSGAVVNVAHAPVTNPGAHIKDNDATYPTVDLQVPMYVVANSQVSNGVGGLSTTHYLYGGLKANVERRGLLGFRWFATFNTEANVSTRTDLAQTYPFTGMPISASRSSMTGGFALASATYAHNALSFGGTRYFPYVARSTERSFGANGELVSHIRTSNGLPDSYGNFPTIVVEHLNDDGSATGYTKSTTNQYAPADEANWFLGRLTRSTVTSTIP